MNAVAMKEERIRKGIGEGRNPESTELIIVDDTRNPESRKKPIGRVTLGELDSKREYDVVVYEPKKNRLTTLPSAPWVTIYNLIAGDSERVIYIQLTKRKDGFRDSSVEIIRGGH